MHREAMSPLFEGETPGMNFSAQLSFSAVCYGLASGWWLCSAVLGTSPICILLTHIRFSPSQKGLVEQSLTFSSSWVPA
jgi:hypothetical protein